MPSSRYILKRDNAVTLSRTNDLVLTRSQLWAGEKLLAASRTKAWSAPTTLERPNRVAPPNHRRLQLIHVPPLRTTLHAIVKPTRQWLALPSGFTRCNGPETFFLKKRKTRYSPRSSLGEQSECTARKKCESGAQKRFAVFGRLATLSLFSVSDPGESGNRKLGGFGPDHTNKGERERKEPGVEGSQWGRDAGRARSHPGRY
jgi:hypothetical protein